MDSERKDGGADPLSGTPVDPREAAVRRKNVVALLSLAGCIGCIWVGALLVAFLDNSAVDESVGRRCSVLAALHDPTADCSLRPVPVATMDRLERLAREARAARLQRQRCGTLAARHDADADCSDDGVAASLRRLESVDREARREERARSQQRAREIAVSRCLVLSAQHDHAADCSESAAPDTVRRLERLAAREERARAEALAALSPADREWRRRLLADRAETASITVGGLCAPAIEAAAQFGFEWTDGWLGATFDRWRLRPNAGEAGSADYLGDSARFQNAFGAWQPAVYSCSVDLSSSTPGDRRVTAVSIRRGRLPR